MPAAEVDIDEALVRDLLAEQHPDLASLPLTPLTHGWDNVIFRLGDELTVRLPRRAMAAELVQHEQRWLPTLAPRLPLAIPAPVRMGRPSALYPWHWSVCPWLPGVIAAEAPPDDFDEAAEVLGQFLAALHQDAPDDAPRNPYRGVPLWARDQTMRTWLEQLGDAVDGERIAALWDDALALPPWDRAPVWVHGDLHGANVLVDQGRVSAVIDFGDVTAGEPAPDLAAAWLVLPSEARPAFRAAAGGPDDDTWARAKGWALHFGVAYTANSADNPLFARMGKEVLAAVLDDEG